MATPTELIQELKLEVNTLKERVEALRGETAPLREITNQLAIIEHKLAEMAKTKELWGQRGWTIFMVAFSACWSVVTGVLVGVVMHYLNNKK